MASYTTNYQLHVPALDDSPPDITQIGANFPKIDQLIKDCFDRPSGSFYLYMANNPPASRQDKSLYGKVMKKFF